MRNDRQVRYRNWILESVESLRGSWYPSKISCSGVDARQALTEWFKLENRFFPERFYYIVTWDEATLAVTLKEPDKETWQADYIVRC